MRFVWNSEAILEIKVSLFKIKEALQLRNGSLKLVKPFLEIKKPYEHVRKHPILCIQAAHSLALPLLAFCDGSANVHQQNKSLCRRLLGEPHRRGVREHPRGCRIYAKQLLGRQGMTDMELRNPMMS